MIRHCLYSLIVAGSIVLPGTGRAAALPMGIDPSQKFAWSENAGWVNFKPSHGQTTVCYNGDNSFLSGYAWAQSVGWIKMGNSAGGPYWNNAATNWGVNMDAAWNLYGYAWSENAGWINFSPAHGQVTVNPMTGSFEGYAWSEKLGWMHFNNATPAYSVRCIVGMATNQVPQWWFWDYGWTNNFDTAALGDQDGDQMLTWQEYVAGTVPTNGASFLGVSSAWPLSYGVRVQWRSVEGKTYRVDRSVNLPVSPAFTTIQSNVPGQAGSTTITDYGAPAGGPCFYRIQVE